MVNYQIALTNAIFDDTYRNVLRFDTRAEQEAYFNVNTLFVNAPLCNFAVGSLYASRVVVDYKDATTIDLNELMNNNYCIVKDNTAGATLKYYYYFVKNAQQDNANRLVCDLELDVYQTYYIDLTFGDCTILRAHLNRFIDNGDNTVSFDATPNSKLFEREEIQDLPKRLTKRTKISQIGNANNSYYDNNILCWLYIYLDPTHDFNFYVLNGTTKTIKPPRVKINGTLLDDKGVPTNIGCLAIPLYKSNSVVKFLNDGQPSGPMLVLGGGTFLQLFEKLNEGYAYVYSVKLSLMPPGANMGNLAPNLFITYGDQDDFVSAPLGIANGDLVGVGRVTEFGPMHVGILLKEQYVDNFNFAETIISDRQLTFNKSEIINADSNPKFNPKLNNSDYYELKLVDTSGNDFLYDLQKFGTNTTKLLMAEPLTPDFTKNYSRLQPPNSNTLYIADTTKNLLGLVTSNDNTMLMPTSAYQTMIANNKNYFAQNSFNRNINAVRSGVNTVVNSLSKGNLLEAGVNAVMGGFNAGLEYGQSVKNQQYEIDNLRNAPASIQAANGNFIFNALYTEPGIYIEEYDITENSRKAVNDYMMLYGFNYNRIDNIKNVDNIRKNYNYVRAYIEEINAGLVNISNIVHNRLREIFARGVRMWNTRTFDYTKENYERWLEE